MRSLRAADRARDALEWEHARIAYRDFLEMRPLRGDVWIQYGNAAKESGHPGEAEIAYRRALALDPGGAEAHLQLGHLLKITGRLAEAEQAYAGAMSRDPSLVDARQEWERLSRIQRALAAPDRADGLPRVLGSVILGTTGICNASCLSCPTGKSETEHVPRIPMALGLSETIFQSIAELALPISDQVSFGLFGDGLADPFVLERARQARERLPNARICVNTNGAAYNPRRHAGLIEHVDFVALHVESLVPATYDHLMQPLRAERVFPKLEQILKDFPDKVFVSVPVSRFNLEELPRIRAFFLERGAHCVNYDPLSNRCSQKAEPFRSMALDPTPIRCPSQALDDLIVDCDGQVLVCCQDFARMEPIGDLTRESLPEVLTNARRLAMRRRFDEGRHLEMKTCSNCYADLRGTLTIPTSDPRAASS